MDARHIQCDGVPEPPTATWSNVLRLGEEVVMSGMTGHPATRQAEERGEPMNTYAQTLRVLEKCKAMVESAGGSLGNIYRLTVYLTDIADKDAVGRARRDFFAGQAVYPTSTLVAVSGLVFPELRVEIEASARLDVDLSTL